MKRQMSAKSRQELMQSLGERYRLGSRMAKHRILDEFVAPTTSRLSSPNVVVSRGRERTRECHRTAVLSGRRTVDTITPSMRHS
jgi:hypothetical protein